MTPRERADEVDAWFKRERVIGSSALRDRIEAAIIAAIAAATERAAKIAETCGDDYDADGIASCIRAPDKDPRT